MRSMAAWAQKWHTHLIPLDESSQTAEPKLKVVGVGGGNALPLAGNTSQDISKDMAAERWEELGPIISLQNNSVRWVPGQCVWVGWRQRELESV